MISQSPRLSFRAVPIVALIMGTLLCGVSCKEEKQEYKSPFNGLTPQQAAVFLREDLQMRAVQQPTQELAAAVAFTDALTASKVVAMIKGSGLQIEQIRSKEAGLGTVSVGENLEDFFRQAYQFANESLARSVTEEEHDCQAGLPACNQATLNEDRSELARLQAQGEVKVASLGVRGPAQDLNKFVHQHAEVFSVVVEVDGRYTTMPLYSDTNMREWY